MTFLTHFSAVLSLLAVVLTSAIPQAWMPMRKDDRILLVICTEEGEARQWVDLAPDSPAHEDESDARPSCHFGGLNQVAILAQPPLLMTLNHAQRTRWDNLDFTHRSAGFFPLYDARGPPHLS